MKIDIKYKWLLSLVLVGILASCSDDIEDLTLESPPEKASLISGTLTLSSIVQNDENAVSKGFPSFVQSIDLASRFDFSDFALELNEDGSFTLSSGGAPNFIGVESGTWSLDDPEFPETVTLNSGSNSIPLRVKTYNGLLEGEINLSFDREFDGKLVSSYQLTFEKQ